MHILNKNYMHILNKNMNFKNSLYVSTSCIKKERNLYKCIKELNKKIYSI
jgi:hypothetical protein